MDLVLLGMEGAGWEAGRQGGREPSGVQAGGGGTHATCVERHGDGIGGQSLSIGLVCGATTAHGRPGRWEAAAAAHTCRMRWMVRSSRLVRGSIELMAMPPVFFFLKKMLGGLRLRRMPTCMGWGRMGRDDLHVRA